MTALAVDARTEPHSHIVNFFDSDDRLVADVAQFFADGLRAGDAAVAVATPLRRTALDRALVGAGIDIDQARAAGRYQVVDAAEALVGVMVDGVPNGERFVASVGAVIDRAALIDRPVRVFGEMVALLWDQGDVAGAIEFEELWNEFGRHRSLSLYCAYSMSSLKAGGLYSVSRVCEEHSEIVPPARYLADCPPGVPNQGKAEVSELFLPVPSAPRAVRRFTLEALRAWGADDVIATAQVIVTELASNAFLHGRSPFRVWLRHQEGRLRITVHDASQVLPLPRRPSALDVGGRGMTLVAGLSTSWGTDLVADGKIVWAEVPFC